MVCSCLAFRDLLTESITIDEYLFSLSPSKFKVQLWFILQKCLEGQSPLMSICSQLHIQLWFILQSLEFTLKSISSAFYVQSSHTILVYPSKLMSISSTTHQDESEHTIKVYSSKVFRGSITIGEYTFNLSTSNITYNVDLVFILSNEAQYSVHQAIPSK